MPVGEKGMVIRAGVNGGMTKKQNLEHKPVNCIAVESTEESVRKIDAPGGEALVPKMEVPGVGWWGTCPRPRGKPICHLPEHVKKP